MFCRVLDSSWFSTTENILLGGEVSLCEEMEDELDHTDCGFVNSTYEQKAVTVQWTKNFVYLLICWPIDLLINLLK